MTLSSVCCALSNQHEYTYKTSKNYGEHIWDLSSIMTWLVKLGTCCLMYMHWCTFRSFGGVITTFNLHGWFRSHNFVEGKVTMIARHLFLVRSLSNSKKELGSVKIALRFKAFIADKRRWFSICLGGVIARRIFLQKGTYFEGECKYFILFSWTWKLL